KNKSLDIVKKLTKEGFNALFTGGAVRDMVIGFEPADFDIVTNAPCEDIFRIFAGAGEKVKKAGKTFAVCLVNDIDVASCRSDSSDSYTAKGTTIVSEEKTSTSEGTTSFPECDLAHRDITINSMAFDPLSGFLIDPFGGRKDLAKKIIRFTGNPEHRIAEDPLRMVRACRFVSWLQGEFAHTTLLSIINNRHLVVEKIAPERIRYEIVKAMSHKKPSHFFRALHITGLLELILPSLSRCADLDGGPHHGETVLEHCLLSGDALSPRKPILRLAGYLHDAGKYDTATIKDGHITFPDHEKMGKAVIRDLQNLRFSNEEIKFVDAVINTHMRPLTPDSTPKAVRRLLAFLKAHDISWQTFMQMRIADKAANLAKYPYKPEDIRLRVDKIWQELKNRKINGCASHPLSILDLDITGNDIMKILDIPSGYKVGQIINYLFEQVLDNPDLNNFESLKKMLHLLYNNNCRANF
ncbi:MAG: CCA tRNA nucleotidyltransferase, partial [Desulfamplus sp.]|nr:CCA tRNA nucleotidyltransferase [Desulfamplus sp.]